MRREPVSKQTGTPRALASGAARCSVAVATAGMEGTSLGAAYTTGETSGARAGGETVNSSLPRSRTQHRGATGAGRPWWHVDEQQRTAPTPRLARAGTPWTTWTASAATTTRMDARRRDLSTRSEIGRRLAEGKPRPLHPVAGVELLSER